VGSTFDRNAREKLVDLLHHFKGVTAIDAFYTSFRLVLFNGLYPALFISNPRNHDCLDNHHSCFRGNRSSDFVSSQKLHPNRYKMTAKEDVSEVRFVVLVGSFGTKKTKTITADDPDSLTRDVLNSILLLENIKKAIKIRLNTSELHLRLATRFGRNVAEKKGPQDWNLSGQF
jgi:hypothetical protein